MKYKIAVVCQDTQLYAQMLQLGAAIDAQLFRLEPQSVSISNLSHQMPNLILLSTDHPQWSATASQVREMGVLREIPIVLVCQEEDEALKEKAILSGVSDLLVRDQIDTQAGARLAQLIEKNSRFVGSYTQRFIRSVVSFCEAEALSASMSGVVRMAAKESQLGNEETVDLLRGAQLLACAIKDANPKSILRFYQSMDFARQLGEMLQGALKPQSVPEQLLYLVYQMQSRVYRGESVEDYQPDWRVDEVLLERVRSLYLSPRIPVSGVMDIDLVWERLSELFCAKAEGVSLEHSGQMMEATRKLLRHALVDHGGAMVAIPPVAQGWLEIAFWDMQLRAGCARAVEQLDGFEQIEIRPLADQGGYRVRIAPKEEKPSIQTPPKTPSFVAPKSKNAADYLQVAQVQWEDLALLRDYEEDLFEHIITTEYTSHPGREVAVMIALLRSYGSTILYLVEFGQIANALLLLGNAIEGLDLEAVETKNLQRLPVVIDGLVRDLRSWREAVFVRQDAPDVHFQDGSIVAACEQILHTLQGGGQEEEMELF